MTNEFKVIPWLRRIREDHATRQSALSDVEKLEQDRQTAARIMPRLFGRRIERHEGVLVAERREPYGAQ